MFLGCLLGYLAAFACCIYSVDLCGIFVSFALSLSLALFGLFVLFFAALMHAHLPGEDMTSKAYKATANNRYCVAASLSSPCRNGEFLVEPKPENELGCRVQTKAW